MVTLVLLDLYLGQSENQIRSRTELDTYGILATFKILVDVRKTYLKNRNSNEIRDPLTRYILFSFFPSRAHLTSDHTDEVKIIISGELILHGNML